MKVGYKVVLADPRAHEFSVELLVEGAEVPVIECALPAWIPGSYMIRDFARNLMDLERLDGGRTPEKLDKQSWRIEPTDGTVRLRYRIYALDLSVRAAWFDDTRAYFNGTSLFLRVLGHDGPLSLVLEPPDWPGSEDWRVATTLRAVAVDERGFGRYLAESHAELIDHPFEIGRFRRAEFMVRDVPHEVVLVDAEHADLERIVRDLKPICEEHVALFQTLPVRRYQFQVLATRDGYGGLEHRDSTSLICARGDLPWPGDASEVGRDYRKFLALCSHEYFHLWNVKRIRPARFADADLSREVHTELLWAFEGITSYYDELALPRAGVIDRDRYLDMLAPSITRYLRNPGRHRQSVAESSFDAWTRFYKQDENAPNAIVSYYTKGALVALGLDVELRVRSGDRLSLDDLMRRLWQRYGREGKGLPERSIEREVADLLGESLDEFFERHVYGVDELPLAEWLGRLGVGLSLRPAQRDDDMGGFVADPPAFDPAAARPALGARLGDADGLVRVEQVIHGGAAFRAGITPGDLLVAIDGERCTRADVGRLLARRRIGDTAEVLLFRRDRLRRVALPVSAAPCDTAELYWLRSPDTAIDARRADWLASRGRHA